MDEPRPEHLAELETQWADLDARVKQLRRKHGNKPAILKEIFEVMQRRLKVGTLLEALRGEEGPQL